MIKKKEKNINTVKRHGMLLN